MLFRVIDVPYLEFVIIIGFLCLIVISYRVFFIIDIMVYFQSDREHAEYLVILLQILRWERHNVHQS